MQSVDGKYYKTDVEDSKFWIIICQTELNKSTKEISETTNPSSFMEHKNVAQRGGNIAREARLRLEEETGKPVVSSLNAKDYLKLELQRKPEKK